MKLTHGGDVYSKENQGLLDFSANINPLGLPQGVKQALHAAVDACARYPDPLSRTLTEAIGRYEGVAPQKILCANGASALFYQLAAAFAPAVALQPAPAFSEYRQAVEAFGGQMQAVPFALDGEEAVPPAFFQAIAPPVSLVFFCNPNNPTGQVVSREQIEEMAIRCAQIGALLVVDECFMDFVQNKLACTAKPLLEAYPNLVIIKAFTKIFAMPGVRLGYALFASPKVKEKLARCGQAWGVSTFAQKAGVAAAKEQDFVEKTVLYVAKERAFLQKGLHAVGWTVFPGAANFLLLHAQTQENVGQKLHERGILVRDCANFETLSKGYIRVAVRTHAENVQLLAAMEGLF